jgi:hypothetical protein
MTDGGAIGQYDIYTAYDYSNDVYTMRNILDWDNSTADTIRVRIYSISWGNDVLIPRYLEAANISSQWGCQLWYEDWYVNATIGPEMSDFDMSGVVWYSLNAWKDSDVFMGSWTMESAHIDWTRNTPAHLSYTSPYNEYAPENFPEMVRPSYSPGTTLWGQDVSYWVPPLVMNLTDRERMTIELPDSDVIG